MAVQFQDYYETLGIPRDADDQAIKAAYRKLARQWHPDLHSGKDKTKAEEKFKEINEAYEVLSDSQKRERYDRLGSNWRSGDPFNPGDVQGGTYYYSGADFSDADLKGFSDFFASLFGSQGRGADRSSSFYQGPLRGQDIESELELTLEEAYQGGSKSLRMTSGSVCSQCHGRGMMQNRSICSRCGGTGNIPETRTLEVNIPRGVSEGSSIRLKGQGGQGSGGGPSGDLYLKVHLKPHPIFQVKGQDVEMEVAIRPDQAVLGDRVSVPTLDRTVSLTIPPGSHSGQRLRLKGKGLPLRSGGRGDQYVRIQVDIPREINDEERKLYEKIREVHER